MRRKYQRRILLNLLVIAVLALFLWVHEGCHLPTLEMELHRTERQRLAEESRVIWTYEGRAYNDRDMLVGTTVDSIHTYSEVYGLTIWPRAEKDPTLVILPDRTRYYDGGSLLGPALLMVGDVPHELEVAKLTIDFSHFSKYLGTYVLYAQEQDIGVYFFQVKPLSYSPHEESHLMSITSYDNPAFLAECPYTLEFTNEYGTLVRTCTNPAAGGASSTN